MTDRKRNRDDLTGESSGHADNALPTSPIAPFSDDDFGDDTNDLDGIRDEAIVDNEIVDILDQDEEEDDDGEDLFGDNLDNDYRENVRLDHYEVESVVDEEEYDTMNREDRLVAEAKMRRRDRELARLEGRLPAAFLDDEEEDENEPMRARRRRHDGLDMDIDLDAGEIAPLDPESLMATKGPLSEFVAMEGPRRTIKKEFHSFLTSYVNDKGESVYGERVKAMCLADGQSLEVDYRHLYSTNATLAYFLSNTPTEILKIFDSVAMEVVLTGYEDYDKIRSEIHVRITNLPIVETLRDLRQSHLNTLVNVRGVVTRRTGVFPQLKYVKYDCLKCGALIGPYHQDAIAEIRVRICPNCQGKNCFSVNSEETIYRNYQRITLQESPGTVPAGRLPRHREVILLWDLVDAARPGEEIEVVGVYRNNFDFSLNTKNGFPVFATVIEANYIARGEDQFSSSRLNEDDQREIRALAADPRIRQRIIKSIAPSIYGHEDIKTALALSVFGGVFKNPQGKHRLRGDINVLLLGDPGTAKSQFLKYIEKTAPRAVYTTGQGASAVGLTAAVHKDIVTREWTLEGGALVMADRGVCLIDEFDKMNDQDRTSIHEAMEQQSISISKAGIVATLQARCAVISAANPIYGKYNPQVPFSQNVELTEPILSRFDILCVVKDIADPIVDERLARFVCGSHMRSHPGAAADGEDNGAPKLDADIIPQAFLRKYIIYAREHVRPTLRDVDVDKLEKLYSELRRESMIGGAIPITVRYLESIIRMSEAFARMHLRDTVRQDDIDHAISVTVRSFISAQKHSVKKSLSRVFDKYISSDVDMHELMHHVLSDILKEHMRFEYLRGNSAIGRVEIDCEEFELRAKEHRMFDLTTYYESDLFQQSFSLDRGRGKIMLRP
ncbi:MCM DNA helicase complex subunit [Batrachochytrium dendrobatidis]|nr:MCM DNA helicase complex subunit [Batrachochytrium dendrobatidis]KAK5670683.1 MCM DNA helicase complex subunit [Batrachochytrium dendrobatidis]